jgi:hypothetical protein
VSEEFQRCVDCLCQRWREFWPERLRGEVSGLADRQRVMFSGLEDWNTQLSASYQPNLSFHSIKCDVCYHIIKRCLERVPIQSILSE